ncbi:MAG: HD-GYP domain-containing protein [Acidimicrobiia bacterium]|nr:HD-GYP domain-containing protein [Acidimicrobiia bacterium]
MDTLLAAMEGVVEDLYGHVHRVSSVASAIGRHMGLDDADVDRLTTVGVLHDVGKIHIDPAILAKPGPLEGDELVRMRRHPQFGFVMTVDLFDRGVCEAILHHHEQWDGSGYPYGLAKEEIPQLARIVLVADAFDAITSHRSYQPALPVEWAMQEIAKHAGTQFDPGVVDAFVEVADEKMLQRIVGPALVVGRTAQA